MKTHNFTHILTSAVDELSNITEMKGLFHQHRHGDQLPSGKYLEEIIDLCRSILFPGYYGKSTIDKQTITYHMGVAIEQLHTLLTEQVEAGLSFACNLDNAQCENLENRKQKAEEISSQFITKLPQIRKVLATDVEATFLGDPAAESYGEIISCYPVIKAVSNFRIAHELHALDVPLIPRIITEMAHSETGIDIHPAAQIGHHFMIDHGTGVVIGATCIIGNNVKLYQGVTLGAKSFPTDDNGHLIRGIARHPILEDNVIIYSNSTILGRITIGKGATIGGNIWVTESVPPGAHIVQQKNLNEP